MKHFLLLSVLLFSVFLYSQNSDSLHLAFANASRTGKNTALINCAKKLGDLFSDEDENDSAVHYYKIAFQHSSDSIEKADIYYHISHSLFFDQSLLSLDYAKKGYRFVFNKPSKEKFNLANLIGAYYSLNGAYDSSFFYYSIALDVAKKLKDKNLLSKVNGNLGDLFSYKGDYSTALKYQLENLNTHEKNKDSSDLIYDYVNIGNTYNSMDKDSIALDYYKHVYPFLKGKKTRLAGNLFNSMSVAYDDLNDTAREHDLLLQSLTVKQALEDSLGISNTLINLGALAQKSGNSEKAIAYFSTVEKIAEKINNSKILRAASFGLGDIYTEKKEDAIALQYFMTALRSSEKDQDLGEQQQALNRIYHSYEKTGNYKMAFDYLKQYQKISESVLNAASVKELADAETKYQSQKKQRDNDRLSYENKLKTEAKEKAERDKQWTIYFSIGSIFAMALIFILVYRNFRIRSNAKEEQKITKAIYESEQKERIRISRDLHDNVGTQLSLISTDIEWITHPLKSLTEKEKSDKLESVNVMAKEVISELRETIWALNKEDVSFEEFSDKLKTHIQKQLKTRLAIQPVFYEQLECTILLGPSEALGLFRICQEAIANSLKYSETTTLEINVVAKNEKYSLSISDKGKGFDVNALNNSNRYGIENMKYRAAEIACKLEISSTPGSGTQVSIHKE